MSVAEISLLIGGINIGFGLVGLILICLPNKHNGHYKRGQVDAINGKIKFELKKNEDGEWEWTYIE